MAGRPKKKGFNHKVNNILSAFNDNFLSPQAPAQIDKLSAHEKLDLTWCALEIVATLKASGSTQMIRNYYDIAMHAYKSLTTAQQYDHAWLFSTMIADDDCTLQKISDYGAITRQSANEEQESVSHLGSHMLLKHSKPKHHASAASKDDRAQAARKREAIESLVSSQKTKMAK